MLVFGRHIYITVVMFKVVAHVSSPYNRTVLTWVLKILTSVLWDNCFAFQILFIWKNTVFAFPICALTSESDRSSLSMMGV